MSQSFSPQINMSKDVGTRKSLKLAYDHQFQFTAESPFNGVYDTTGHC